MDIAVTCQFQVIERYVKANYFDYNEENVLNFKPYYHISALIDFVRDVFEIESDAPVDLHINMGERTILLSNSDQQENMSLSAVLHELIDEESYHQIMTDGKPLRIIARLRNEEI